MKQTLFFTFTPPEKVLTRAKESFDVTIGDYTGAFSCHADAIMVTTGQRFASEEISRLSKSTKVLATCSVGFDHLDIEALKARNILATNTPDVLTDATADLTMALLLNTCRRIREYIHIVDKGWGRKMGIAEMLGTDLRGKRLGIFGMGRIGQGVARRAQAFGMEILYCNRNQLPPEKENGAKFFKNFHEMLPHCQVLSLHAPGTKDTDKVIGAQELRLLPRGAVLVNVARGSLIDEEALLASLEAQHLFGVGLDVCMNEPNPDPRFLKFPNVTLTPHMGSATVETRNAMGIRALENIIEGLSGKVPRDTLWS